MRFDEPGRVEEVVWNMRLSELPRADNRAILNRLYNGAPPFDPATAEENGVNINYNFLEGPNLLSQGRRQWNNAFLKAGNYFTVTLDSGPKHKRVEWSKIVTKHLNRALKRSPDYMETIRATGANTILHGLAPSNWESRTAPFHTPLMVDDLLIPSETLVSFRNLDHFAIFRQYSPAQLYQLTHGPKRDPGWDMPTVDAEIKIAAQEYQKSAYSVSYQFQPEKIEEYIKQDLGFWGSDSPPTIDCWDFYFREAEDGDGWYRRVILDSALSAEQRGSWRSTGTRPSLTPRNVWLYTSGKRKYATNLRHILHCQFGDTSAVAPFRYHSVRSLGYMLFGVCELQNRLRCRFSEAVFEQLMWFFRTSNEREFTRLKKAMFTHLGVIPQGIDFVTADQRFKPDHNLISLQLAQNRELMGENAASFTQDFEQGSRSKEMTATETMARVNSVNALVGGMLNLAYTYETYQYRETSRRFCLPNSPHKVVKDFRLACLKDGVPEEAFDSDHWDIEPERVLGGGNKVLEIAQVQQLLAIRPQLGPEGQRRVDRLAVFAFTDDPAEADLLVPPDNQQHVSDAKHSASLAVGTIMAGGFAQFMEDQNLRDVVETLLIEMGLMIQRIQATGGMPSKQEVMGLINFNTHLEPLIAHIAQDQKEGERAKQYSQQLGNMMNAVKGFAQRVAEQEKAQMGNGAKGQAAETAGKVQAGLITAGAKAANTRESHAQKTAQKQVSFEAAEQQKEQKHQQELRRTAELQHAEDTAKIIETAEEVRRDRIAGEQEKSTKE